MTPISEKRIRIIRQKMMRYATKHGWDDTASAWLADTFDAIDWASGASEAQHAFVADDLRRVFWNAVYATIGK